MFKEPKSSFTDDFKCMILDEELWFFIQLFFGEVIVCVSIRWRWNFPHWGNHLLFEEVNVYDINLNVVNLINSSFNFKGKFKSLKIRHHPN